jgi:hypothetical protein
MVRKLIKLLQIGILDAFGIERGFLELYSSTSAKQLLPRMHSPQELDVAGGATKTDFRISSR